MYYDKISDIIEKYRNKSNDRRKKLRFISNVKNLNPNLTAFESQLINNSLIWVIIIY